MNRDRLKYLLALQTEVLDLVKVNRCSVYLDDNDNIVDTLIVAVNKIEDQIRDEVNRLWRKQEG